MLNSLFSPKSIAVIGASREKGKIGNDILRNIKNLGYKGKIYPVNPKAKKIFGLTCYPNIKKIKGKVDLAVIVVPAQIVSLVLQECGEKKIPSAIIISAGFKESGPEGIKLEQKIINIAREFNIQLLGPNCLGIINTYINLNASFAKGLPNKGNVGLIFQSGALAVAICDWAEQFGFGFSKVISLGNKSVLTENEILEYLGEDKETEVILMYLESIAEGRRFMEIAKKVTVKKPVIVIKSGITEKGAEAVSSHTGVLAGLDEAVEAAFIQSGIIRAHSVEDLFDLAKAFSYQNLLWNNAIAIITNAGGPGVIATDALKDTQLKLAEFSKETIQELRVGLPKAASFKNPVDLVGDAKADRYKLACESILKDKNVAGVIVILTPQTLTEKEKTAQLVSQFSKKHKEKPLLTSFMGGKDVYSAIQILNKNHIPNYKYPNRAVYAINTMWRYFKIKKEHKKTEELSKIFLSSILKKRIKEIFIKADQKDERQITGIEAEEILKIYNIPTLKSGLAKNISNGLKIANQIRYPVALKIVSPDIIHKSDIGGVKINIKNNNEFVSAFKEILDNVEKKMPKAKIEGIWIQEMVARGKEIILGMKKDVQFGPLIMFGLGGVFVEVIKDVSFRIAPVSKKEAFEMILETKGAKILKGIRGEPSSDINSVVDVICKLSQLCLDISEVKELDLNPLVVFEEGKGAKVVDVRMAW